MISSRIVVFPSQNRYGDLSFLVSWGALLTAIKAHVTNQATTGGIFHHQSDAWEDAACVLNLDKTTSRWKRKITSSSSAGRRGARSDSRVLDAVGATSRGE